MSCAAAGVAGESLPMDRDSFWAAEISDLYGRGSIGIGVVTADLRFAMEFAKSLPPITFAGCMYTRLDDGTLSIRDHRQMVHGPSSRFNDRYLPADFTVLLRFAPKSAASGGDASSLLKHRLIIRYGDHVPISSNFEIADQTHANLFVMMNDSAMRVRLRVTTVDEMQVLMRNF
jgi:hypothetical protein